MSKLSIYENRWINLVFEGKNHAYGAYQLRKESSKTTATAFFAGLLFITALACIPFLANLMNGKTASLLIPKITEPVIHLTLLNPLPPKLPKQVMPVVKTVVSDAKPKARLRNPQIVKPIEANPNLATNKENTNAPVTPTQGTGIVTGANPTSGEAGNLPVEIPKPNGLEIVTSAVVDVMPEFPGGVKKFLDYIGNNFEKPEIEMTVSIVMSFVIEKDGTMTDIKVLRNPGYGLDKEAIRVLKSLKTKWKPGIKNGQPIRVLYTLPIRVQP